jgi:hypothetical protein
VDRDSRWRQKWPERCDSCESFFLTHPSQVKACFSLLWLLGSLRFGDYCLFFPDSRLGLGSDVPCTSFGTSFVGEVSGRHLACAPFVCESPQPQPPHLAGNPGCSVAHMHNIKCTHAACCDIRSSALDTLIETMRARIDPVASLCRKAREMDAVVGRTTAAQRTSILFVFSLMDGMDATDGPRMRWTWGRQQSVPPS